MTNPIPNRITDPLWDLWLECKRVIPGVRLGGIYANKRGYHNTRANNLKFWPNDYSIRLDADKLGPSDKAAAIDLTMSGDQMVRRTNYLYRSALNKGDPRLRPLREFIGTRDGEQVYCRIAGNSSGLGEGRGSNDWGRDSSHLWHIHISILRQFVNSSAAMAGISSVLSGESLAEFMGRQAEVPSGTPILELTDPMTSGPRVRALQIALNQTGEDLEVDGWYGSATKSAVEAFQRDHDLAVDGVYGPNTEEALREELSMPSPEDIADAVYRKFMHTVGENDFAAEQGWQTAGTKIHPRKALQYAWAYNKGIWSDTQQILKNQVKSEERQIALLGTMAGDSLQTILDKVDAHAEEVKVEFLAVRNSFDEVLNLVDQATSGDLAAEEVVRLIGEKLRNG